VSLTSLYHTCQGQGLITPALGHYGAGAASLVMV
jgi:hypothetical protein